MEDCLEAEEHRTAIGGGGAEEAQLLLARQVRAGSEGSELKLDQGADPVAAGLQRSEGRDGTSRFSRRGGRSSSSSRSRGRSSSRSSISQRGGGRDRGLRQQVVGFQRGEQLAEELLHLILRLRAAIPPVRCFPIVASAFTRAALLAAAAALLAAAAAAAAAGIGVGVRIAQGSEDAQSLRGGVASLGSPGGHGEVAVRGREGAERRGRVVGRHAPASERHQLRSRPLQELC